MTERGGLSTPEVIERRREFGSNTLPERRPPSLLRRFLTQFRSPLIYILGFALLFDLGLWVAEGGAGWPIEAVAIAIILGLNAALGTYQEFRSEAALARLKALAAAQAWALRDGALTRVPTAELVPGDVVRLEAGDRVPADGVLREAHGASFDESMLTGESLPVDKDAQEDAFSGALLVRGHAWVEVTRIGITSAMGKLAHLLGDIEETSTPLERRVDRLGRDIARAVLATAALIAGVGVMVEGAGHAAEMVVFAVALAVAAVPEGLPAVLTVALALGVERMAARKAVVRRLAAVEALGSVTVIVTDKTGTLTENRIEVRSIESRDEARALDAVVLANDADDRSGAGDPLDLGLLRFARARGVEPEALRARWTIVSQRPFDSAWRFTRVTVTPRHAPAGPDTAGQGLSLPVHAGQDHARHDRGIAARAGDTTDARASTVSYVKGAPEAVLARCALSTDERARWTARASVLAAEGHRVLAVASGRGEVEDGLTWLGLALLWDPPRAEVPAAIREARAAGIRVLMLTGDHPQTAMAVAQLVGLDSSRAVTGEELDRLDDASLIGQLAHVNVFARVRPEQKLRLVEVLQSQGEIVAMTGDGVNDAPALKRSDIGVAMGQRGSDVTREVADLVLLDDNFATIVTAVAEGRGIYENIQKFLRFLLSTNLSEVALVATGVFLSFALGLREADGAVLLPLTAAQILWINLITDGLPALALAFDRVPGVMARPPRPPHMPLLDRPSLTFVLGAGLAKAALGLVLLGAIPLLGYGTDIARAVTFHFMAIGQLLLTYASRRTHAVPLTNRALHAAVGTGVALQVGLAWWPGTSTLFAGELRDPALWGVVVCSALAAWAMAQSLSRLLWRDSALAAQR